MESQRKIEDSGFSLSFSCYSSDSLTSKAVEKVIREQQAPQLHVEGENFEFTFSLDNNNEDSPRWTTFPVFNRDLDHEVKAKDDKIDVSVSTTGPLAGKLFIDEQVVSYSSSNSDSSSESEDDLDNTHSGTFCVWRPKVDSGSSSPKMTKCKKSISTGSGSKRWSIRYLLKRSNSEGMEQPMALLSPKKLIDSPKQKVSRRLKGQTRVHEQFYVQRRAENEIVKRKTFLPYRQGLVGLFANVNGMGKMLPF